MFIHMITGMTIIVITYSLAFPVINYNRQWKDFTRHDIGGLITLALTGLLGIGGFLLRMAKRRLRWQSNKLKWFTRIHNWFGYLLLAAA